jgi:hypothetical protein
VQVVASLSVKDNKKIFSLLKNDAHARYCLNFNFYFKQMNHLCKPPHLIPPESLYFIKLFHVLGVFK